MAISSTGRGGLPTYSPGFTQTPIGSMVGNELYDPETGGTRRTGEQRGTDAGQALRALAEASGLSLLGSSSGTGIFGGSAGGSAPQVTMPDTSAANTAIYGRAKDTAGQEARASLTALNEIMAERGLLGSGIATSEGGKAIERARGGVSEVSREQAIRDAAAANRRGELEYQGRITQRGQDINAAQEAAARQQSVLQGLLSVLPQGLLY